MVPLFLQPLLYLLGLSLSHHQLLRNDQQLVFHQATLPSSILHLLVKLCRVPLDIFQLLGHLPTSLLSLAQLLLGKFKSLLSIPELPVMVEALNLLKQGRKPATTITKTRYNEDECPLWQKPLSATTEMKTRYDEDEGRYSKSP
ncbi:hypothetical protein BHM03_00004524 [Ensete ventricosum]|nr:hypothetical protein BHM03_00004524 [Ensete ventricosum]